MCCSLTRYFLCCLDISKAIKISCSQDKLSPDFRVKSLKTINKPFRRQALSVNLPMSCGLTSNDSAGKPSHQRRHIIRKAHS